MEEPHTLFGPRPLKLKALEFDDFVSVGAFENWAEDKFSDQ